MKFLLINYYKKSLLHKFDNFYQWFKKQLFSKRFIHLLVELKIVRELKELNEYIFIPTSPANNRNDFAKNFDLVDVIVVVGNSSRLPWSKSNRSFLEFMRIMLVCKKHVFVSGSAMLSFVYLTSIDFQKYQITHNVFRTKLEHTL